METALLAITAIIGAHVFIVTIQRLCAGGACPLGTEVPHRAQVTIITRFGIELVVAALLEIAQVVSTRILVIAVDGTDALALPHLAMVALGAGIAIITTTGHRAVEAPDLSITQVLGTDIVVVTGDGLTGLAGSAYAQVFAGTGVPVRAGCIGGRMLAPGQGIAHVFGTRIVVVTVEGAATLTLAVDAAIGQSAGVLVVARAFNRFVLAALQGVAGIQGAWVTIVAIEGNRPRAGARGALIAQRAGIAIGARPAGICREQLAAAGTGIAPGHQARRVRPLGRWAVHHGCGVYSALKGHFGQIAYQGTVTDIVIFKSRTIEIALAITIHRHPDALAALTGIPQGAGLTVIAAAGGGFVETATVGQTDIGGADVIVVAIQGRAMAESVGAGIFYGAGVAIIATARHHLVLTPVDATTGILGTGIGIVTIDVVNGAIAIIVNTIAHLLGRHLGITVRQSAAGTETHPPARPVFVGDGTQGVIPLKEGRFRTFTRFLCDALARLQAQHRRRHLALVARRTPSLTGALATTKPSVIAVVEAEVYKPASGEAIVIIDARSAEHRQSGQTGEQEIGPTQGNLLAGPADGALLDTELRTDFSTQVLDAKPRLAILVVQARVQKTTVPGCAVHKTVGVCARQLGRPIKVPLIGWCEEVLLTALVHALAVRDGATILEQGGHGTTPATSYHVHTRASEKRAESPNLHFVPPLDGWSNAQRHDDTPNPPAWQSSAFQTTTSHVGTLPRRT